MKPEASSPGINIESAPVSVGYNIETLPDIILPEQGIEKGAERYEQRAEASAISSDVGLTTTIPTPVVTQPVVVGSTTLSTSPLVANDDDLIEKEWVDKAKKIISDTQNDPHLREKEVSKLQVEYIKKRYGRELGVTD